MIPKFILPSLLSFVVLSCSTPLPELEGVDTKVWKSDKYACLNERSKFIGSITTQKDKLKSLTEDDMIALLGRPDENELYTRNQKFYRYFLEPGPTCGSSSDHPKKLIIRFNAIGLAKEVSVE